MNNETNEMQKTQQKQINLVKSVDYAEEENVTSKADEAIVDIVDGEGRHSLCVRGS